MSEHDIIEIKPLVSVKEPQEPEPKKKKNWIRIGIVVAAVLAAIVGTYFLITRQTYSKVKVSSTVEDKGSGENQYLAFAGKYLKYGKDGVSLVNKDGEESWNHAYEMQNPMVDISGTTAAVADNDGNAIVVVDKSGLKGEIETALPIEKVSVSDEGVVAALMKGDSSPTVICYDATGNVLVEHKASVTSSGYPMDIAISKDGYTMAVTYLYIEGTGYSSKIIYYNFGEEGQGKTDNVVAEDQYSDTIIPSIDYVDKNTSVAVGDSSFYIIRNAETKKVSNQYKLNKTINSTFHTSKYIGFVLQNAGSAGYELRVYNLNGKQVLSQNMKSEYANITMIGRQILMHDGERMCIYSLNGIKRFEGTVDGGVIGVYPSWGLNKYRVISADGMKVVRLVK